MGKILKFHFLNSVLYFWKKNMNLALVFQSGDFVLISVFIILVIMSIVTWSIIILRAIRLRKAKNGNAAVKKLVLASFAE